MASVPETNKEHLRWCVGEQRVWRRSVKRLSIIPLILLPVLLVIIYLTKHASADLLDYEYFDNDTLNYFLENFPRDYPTLNLPMQPNNLQDEDSPRLKINDFTEDQIYPPPRFDSILAYNKPPKRQTSKKRPVYSNYTRRMDKQNNKRSFYFGPTNIFLGHPLEKNRRDNDFLDNNFPSHHTYHKYIMKRKSNSRIRKAIPKKKETKKPPKPLRNHKNPKYDVLRPIWHSGRTKDEIRYMQSELMKKYLNLKVNPCDDFYQFACGNWKHHYSIPPDRTAYDVFEMVRENLDCVLKDLIEKVPRKPMPVQVEERFTSGKINEVFFSNVVTRDPQDGVTKAKIYYESCMNEPEIESRGDEPLRNILDDLGGWPLVDVWDEHSFDLVWLLSKLRLLNNDILISLWIAPDMRNSDQYIIHIDQTSLGLPSREYFVDDEHTKYMHAYKDFLLSVANLMGSSGDDIEDQVDEIIEFEVKLAEIMTSSEERQKITDIYLRTNTAALTLYFPQFEWSTYFEVTMGKKLLPTSTVACYCVKYLHKLFALLSVTPSRIVQNYVIWRFVRHRVSNLGHVFLDAKQKFYKTLFGREQLPPRWQYCISQVNLNMGMALGSLFVRNFFDDTSRSDTIKMTKDIEEAFKASLLENDWLEDTTKEYARLKIDAMDLKIGFPDLVLKEKELSKLYENVTLHPNYFFENTVLLLRHLTRNDLARVANHVNKSIWTTPPSVINAYYSRNKNQILFPAGILQPPFYHKHFPKALNFGGIGVVIGHEITHGFDDKGRLFDYEGNLFFWWKSQSLKKFKEKAKCIIDQYNNYMIPEINAHINGVLTQGENIADNGGLRQAFRAYETWLSKNSHKDEYMPGLNYTAKQLFFINFAQVWCGQQRIEVAQNRIRTSVHSPGIFRVIGAAQNSKEFSEAFHCSPNDFMNPKVKCLIW